MSAELPITGYLDRFSRRPGETFQAKVSLRDGGRYRARLVRVVCGDPNPAGPGMKLLDMADRFDIAVEGRRQPIRLGSYGLVPRGPRRDPAAPCTWTALVWPGLLRAAPAAVLAEEGGAGPLLSLALAADGAQVTVSGAAGPVTVSTGAPLRARCWYRVWASTDPASGRVVVGQVPLGPSWGVADRATGEAAVPGLRLPDGTGPLTIAARDAGAPGAHLTGKIEDPAVLALFRDSWDDALVRPAAFGARLLAGWDFARGIAGQAIEDVGPQRCAGTLVNLPTRAVCGASWSGREMCWRHAPEDYAAIHFHEDDLGDCGWETDFAFTVPADLASGAYAFHLSCDQGEDWLPFYVLPARGAAAAPIAFLASTFTYQAYANHARGNRDAAYAARAAQWGAYPYNPDDYPLYGRSTYNKHPDGSGVSFSSRLRPILTMRPGFLTFVDPRGSGLRHYPADTHLLSWLEAKGLAFDIVTDEDLDEEGVELLRPYRVVLTGSHPEYHTGAMLDALQAYTQGGGRLVYLGGNGFYWRIARTPALPGVIEVRRAEGGIRAWAAEPGEAYHALDGQYGGLWRRNGRPPQALVGVGFSAQGLFEGSWYRRLPASREPRFAWMFEGIEGDVLGDYGLSGGGAAGFELDRADPMLGTPPNAVILARSEKPPASFVVVPEELLSHIATVTGEKPAELLRAEIVHFETEGGGAVLSVGSITFCGSLWREGYDNPVSRFLENVVRRFAAP